jgi:peptide/nickel transport system substrate-binding protein
VNAQGKELVLTLLTSNKPETYPLLAEKIKQQWEALGVGVKIEVPKTRKDFEQRMLLRDYDVLLFGQSLLDNLDSYPYWHSSQTQEQGDKQKLKLDAFNLSQYASFEADSLLARIRETSDMKSREKALKELNEILKRDVPAVFLYSPLYVFAYDDSISGIQPGSLALHSDRFLTLSNWYISTNRQFKEGRSWLSLPGWLLRIGR